MVSRNHYSILQSISVWFVCARQEQGFVSNIFDPEILELVISFRFNELGISVRLTCVNLRAMNDTCAIARSFVRAVRADGLLGVE